MIMIQKILKKLNKIFKKLKNEKYSLIKLILILKEIDKIASFRKLYDFINADVEETIVIIIKLILILKLKKVKNFMLKK